MASGGEKRLIGKSETELVRTRHYAHYLRFVEARRPPTPGMIPRPWVEAIAAERDNIAAALRGCESVPGGTEPLLRLVGTVWYYWLAQGPADDARRWMSMAFDENGKVDPSVRLSVMRGLAILSIYRCDYNEIEELRRVGLTLSHRTGDARSRVILLAASACGAFEAADIGRAIADVEEAISVAREANDRWGIHIALQLYGVIRAYRGDWAEAEALERESLALAIEVGDRVGVGYVLEMLGRVHHYQGRFEEARDCYREALAGFREAGERRGVATVLEGLAMIDAVTGREERSARCFGAAEAFRDLGRTPLDRGEQEEHVRYVALVRDALGDERYSIHWTEGFRLPIDRIDDAALGEFVGAPATLRGGERGTDPRK